MPGKKHFLILILFFLVSCVSQQTAPSQPPVVDPNILSTYVAQTLTALAPTESAPQATPTPLPAMVSPTEVGTQPTMIQAGFNQTATPQPVTASPVPSSATPTKPAESTPTAAASPTKTAAATATQQPTVSPTATQPPAATATATTQVKQDSSAAPASSDCIDKAGFFSDVTIPDRTLLPMNTDFVKTWRFRNEGTCTWGDGYKLVFAQGQILGGPPTSPIPRAAPGEIIDVSVNLKTPSDGGTYAGDWQFQNAAGKRFGVNSHGEDFFYVIIRVDWGPGVGPTATPPPVNCAYDRNANFEAQLLQLINSARAANRLPALTLQSQLSAAAQIHSVDMACNSYLDHNGSDKSNYSERIKRQGYKSGYDSENIYAGGSAQEAFDWWMNSKIHRENILSSKITQIGIGFAYAATSKFGGYYTLDFARP